MVELGFVTNPDEGAKLVTDAYQEELAEAISHAVLSFLTGRGSEGEGDHSQRDAFIALDESIEPVPVSLGLRRIFPTPRI